MSNVSHLATKEKSCEDCGGTIPSARVIAIPHVRVCVDCQQDREKNGNYQRHKMSVQHTFKGDEIENTEETIVRSVRAYV